MKEMRFILVLIIALFLTPPAVLAQDEEEDIFVPDWVENNQQAFEYFEDDNKAQMFVLYPGELPYEEGVDGSWGDEGAQQIAEHMDYMSVTKWLAVRDGLRKEYADLLLEITERYEEGVLSPDARLVEYCTKFERFKTRMWNLWSVYNGEYEYEYNRNHYEYDGFWQLAYGRSVLLQDNSVQTGASAWDLSEGYGDLGFIVYRDRPVVGYSISVCSQADGVKHPQAWALYGYYSTDGNFPDADSPEWKLIDARSDYNFPAGDSVTVVFDAAHPGIYNRFYLRMYKRDDQFDERLPSVGIQEFSFIDGDVQITDDAPIPDPELPKFMVTFNEVEKNRWFWPCISVKTDIGTLSSPFRFRDRQAKAVFHHINPEAKDFTYKWYTPLRFDDNGELTVALQDSKGWNIFQSDEAEGYYIAPGHICDVYLSTDVVEKATGRNYTLTDTIPLIVTYPKPTLSVEEGGIITARDVQEATYEATIKDLDDEQGFTIKVELEDYASGTRQTRVLEYEFEPWDGFYNESNGHYSWIGVPGTNWLHMNISDGKLHECYIDLSYWAKLGQDDVRVTLTATNTVGMAASTMTKTFHCDQIDVSKGFRASYQEGFDANGAVHDISEWRTSNQSEVDAFKTAFDAQDTPAVKAAYKAWEESLKKTIIYSAPAVWGPATVLWDAEGHRSELQLPAGDGKFYVGYPGIDLTETFTISWPEVGVSKTFSYTSHDMPSKHYVFCPTVEGASGRRSITAYYTDRKGEQQSVTVMGNFGADEAEPDYLFIHDEEGIREFGQMLFRDNTTGAIAGFNRFYHIRKEGTATYSGSGDYWISDFEPIFKQYGYNYLRHCLILSSTPRLERHVYPLDKHSFTMEETPVVRLQLIDEDGEPITDGSMIIRTATITQPISSESAPLGTTRSFSAVKAGVEMQADRLINGVLEIPVPADPDGGINHVLVEICQDHWAPKYKPRLFSEFTDPEAFTNYINKGLPYPCVIRRFPNDQRGNDYDSFINTLTTRPADDGLFSSSRTPYSLDDGTDMGYEGQGKSRIDMLVGLRRYSAHYDAEFEEGIGPMFKPAGAETMEENWNFNYAYKLFSPRRAADVANPAPYDYNRWRFAPEAMDDVELAADDYGRPIYWSSAQTGFRHSYAYLSCRPTKMIEDMRKTDTAPHSEFIGLGEFDKGLLDASGQVSGYCKKYYSSIGTFYNTAVEEIDPEALINSVAATSTPGYDGNSMPSEKSTDKISGGLKGFSMATPSCLPFANVLVTSDIGEYRIRSSFELNALDFLMPQNEAMDRLQKMQTRVNDVSNYLQQFLLIKNSCLGDYTTDIFDTDDGVFVGFKGFVEMAVIKDHKANKWTPYFTGFGAKAEASAQFTWKMQAPPFIAKMITRGEMSSSFMLLNPHPEDFVYKQSFLDPKQGLNEETFNPYSHFNIYVNSTFDLQLCLQAGIGFDAGFIAAHGGLMGKARAAARFAYVDRPYLSGSLRRSAGARFDLAASLSAYAYFKFLFLKYTKEWPICGVSKTYWSPDNDWNPLKSDPNLRPELLEEQARMRVRPLTMTYRPQRRRVSVIGSRLITDKVDIFANPIYMNGGRRLALFCLNDPADPNDDRVIVSADDCNVDRFTSLYKDDVPSFAYHAASAGDHQIVAVQRLAQQLADGDTDMEAAHRLTDKLQIVASVADGSGDFHPSLISQKNTANQDPKAAIAQNGSAAVVWASGDISVEEKSDGDGGTYSDPSLTGHLVLSEYIVNEYGEGSWTRPAELLDVNALSPVKDYTIATGGKHPLVMASVPGVGLDGSASAPVCLFTVNGLGIARRTSLGIEGAQHQLVAVYEPGQKTTDHFIASCIVNAGEDGKTDIQLFDITLGDDGSIRHSSLGRLGLDKYRILSYRLVSPKDGAHGVDGLGVIWNQHEQENTDDETLDAIPYNRTYVARINRRGDYIYLSHAAQALDLSDSESVADMTAFMDYDTERKCPVVTAAFCLGETQVDGASTAAEIIEKRVSLNNEIEWNEAATGLSSIIDRKNGTEIKIGVRNIGLHTIKQFTVEMAGQTFEQAASVAPSEHTTITIKLPASTNFDNDIPFTITADFYDIDVTDVTDAGLSTGSASVSGAFKVNVVDFCTALAVNRLDRTTEKNVVTIAVSNLSPMALKPDGSVKVSLFTDALGDTQYGSVATYTIPASELYNAEQQRPLVKTVRFFVDAPAARTTVYAICRTVDADGNVVFDQNTSDNVTLVSLAPARSGSDNEAGDDAPTIGMLTRLIRALGDETKATPDLDYNNDGLVNMDDFNPMLAAIAAAAPDRLTVSDLLNPQLKVANDGRSITVSGLNPEKDLKVFDATGRLLKWTEPAAEEATVDINAKGTLIIVNDGKAGIIRH